MEEEAAIRIQAVVRGRAARRRDKLRADLPTEDQPEPAQTRSGDKRSSEEPEQTEPGPESEGVSSSAAQVEAAQAEIRKLLAETSGLGVGGVRRHEYSSAVLPFFFAVCAELGPMLLWAGQGRGGCGGAGGCAALDGEPARPGCGGERLIELKRLLSTQKRRALLLSANLLEAQNRWCMSSLRL